MKLDLRDFEAGLKQLGKRSRISVMRAINRTAASERTQAKREIAKDTGIKAGDVDKALAVSKATPEVAFATVTASGRRLPLIAFNARGAEPSRGRGRGVSYRLLGGRGRVPSAFIATMRSGHRGVFARFGASRDRSEGAWSPNLPIRELFGPSLPLVFIKRFLPEAPARSVATLAKNLKHEIEFALKR
jgi:hypothetical protein